MARSAAILDVRLDDVLKVDDAEQPGAVHDRERRASRARDGLDRLAELLRRVGILYAGKLEHRIDRTLADTLSAAVHAGEASLRGEGYDHVWLSFRQLSPKISGRQGDD